MNDVEKIVLNKNAVDDVVGINLILKDGSSRYVTGPDMDFVAFDFDCSSLKKLEKNEKAEVLYEKIESIDILERDKFFAPTKIRVAFGNGVLLTVDNDLSLTDRLNEYLSNFQQSDSKESISKSFSNEMDLFEYLLSNFAIKEGIQLDKLPLEISKNPMLKSRLHNEILGFVFKCVSCNMCNYFIGNLARQEKSFVQFLEDKKDFFEKYSYNGMIKNCVKYDSITILKADEYGTPLEAEITFESGKKLKVEFKHIIMDFCNEIHSNHDVEISEIFNDWKNPQSNSKSSVTNLNINQDTVSNSVSFSKIVKNMFGFMKKGKEESVKKR